MIERIVLRILLYGITIGGWLLMMNFIVNDTFSSGRAEFLAYSVVISGPVFLAMALAEEMRLWRVRKGKTERQRQREAEKKRRESLSGEERQRAREAEKEAWQRRREEALK